MKITVVGAGAIGGLIGTRLAATGAAEVTALARGATLQALREHGWRLQSEQGLLQAPARATDSPATIGVQDAVILTVKAPALAQLAPTLQPLLGPHTLIVPAMNGVPWWFCSRVPGFEDQPLVSLDPQGLIDRSLPLHQVVGCVVHASAAVAQPGLVVHRKGHGLILGEPFGGRSARVQALCDRLQAAGFEVTHADAVRRDIWYKLWGNLTMNPVSALTGAPMDQVLGDPLLRQFCSQAMQEAARLGAHLGCPIEQSPEDRHRITEQLGAVKTSMLQDVEAGRPIELDAIVTAVHEIARRLQEPTPAIDALLGLTRVMARQRGLYGVEAAPASA